MTVPMFLRLSDICGRRNPPKPGMLPISPNTVWRLVRNGQFPKPVKLGPNSTAWRFAEVKAWADARCTDGDEGVQ
jgi:predicted DNA-binding transcriptional regulator AlpA